MKKTAYALPVLPSSQSLRVFTGNFLAKILKTAWLLAFLWSGPVFAQDYPDTLKK